MLLATQSEHPVVFIPNGIEAFKCAIKKQLTPWSTVLPEKLTVPQLIKKLSPF
jgi:hypothetical protein